MARTFRATLTLAMHGKTTWGKVPIATEVVEEMGLMPGESLKASMRNTEFTGKVFGSLRTPGLLIPIEIVRNLGLREGQGVRVTVLGRA